MYSDIDCPYCGASQDIDHDDGYGYNEDVLYQQECCSCGETFGYRTSIMFHYDVEQVPCFNGHPHVMISKPQYAFPDYKRCEHCDHVERGEYVEPPLPPTTHNKLR